MCIYVEKQIPLLSLTVLFHFICCLHAPSCLFWSAAMSVGPWMGLGTLISLSESPKLCYISISDVDDGAGEPPEVCLGGVAGVPEGCAAVQRDPARLDSSARRSTKSCPWGGASPGHSGGYPAGS